MSKIIKENPSIYFVQHKGWQNHPNKRRGVTWDGKCFDCGYEIKDQPFDNHEGLGISFENKRLALYGLERTFEGEFLKDVILCKECAVKPLVEGVVKFLGQFVELLKDPVFRKGYVEFLIEKDKNERIL